MPVSFKSGHGYTRSDWDAVSDNPTITSKQIAEAKPLSAMLPELSKAIEKEVARRGRPRTENPKEAVTLRLDPGTVARFKSAGDDWRARMAQALETAKV